MISKGEPQMSKKEKTAAEQNEAQQETAAAEEVKTEQQPEEKTELEKLQQDYAALNDKYLRLIAEYDNFRKRSQRERDAIYPDATVAAAGVFLPVADNFERAIAAECADAEYKKVFTNQDDGVSEEVFALCSLAVNRLAELVKA